MNEREVGEIRRRVRRDRSNMTAIYGCFVNDSKEIVSEYRISTATMPENEAERYFGLMKKTLSGTLGKNLVDIVFRTAQVADSPEHRLLMDLRSSRLQDEEVRLRFYRKIMDAVTIEGGYLILMACDSYDVPFKSKDGTDQPDASGETFTYLLCSICPVKQTKGSLRYVAEEKLFHDGGVVQAVAAPALGFMFPAFDQRATNIYNALMYTHDAAQGHEAFVEAVFNTKPVKPAAEQKKSFEALLSSTLGQECSLDVVQTVHDHFCQAIELHKESRVAEPLMVNKEQVQAALASCGISEEHMAKFSVEFDETFGHEAELHPKNLIDHRKFEIHTPDVSIKVDPARADLIETRIIGGVKYILICADQDVEVNGVSIHIGEEETAGVV